MNTAPLVRLVAADFFESPYRLRLPFRFGVITVTEGRQAIVRVRIRLADGREGEGHAAEALSAKWFDKNPALSDAQNVDQLRRALELTREAYLGAAPATAFGLFADHYDALMARGRSLDLPPLVTGYGPALIDRAVFDALCRLLGTGLHDAMRANLGGMRAHAVLGDLAGFDFDAFLAGLAPLPRLQVRHTVGLLDPIVASDQPPGTRVDDGLPETLEEVVRVHGNRAFKLKLSGRAEQDRARLRRVAGVLDRLDSYQITLDGNEQYDGAEAVAELWHALRADPALRRLCAATLFIEQPIQRQAALAAPVDALARLRPVIIDESDGELDAFPRARALGYEGVSTKACKGFYKSLANLARCRLWNAQEGRPRYFMSAEDLTTQPGLSVQQDLALVSLMGIAHVERNAHHFIDGFDGRPVQEAEDCLAAQPALYRREGGGPVRLRIEAGNLDVRGLGGPGFGAAPPPRLDGTAPMPPSTWDASPHARGPKDTP